MSTIQFTPEERRLIALYASIRSGIGPRLNSWVAEIIPAILLLTYGLSLNKRVFIVAGFLPLIFFSSMRMYRQHKYAQLLQKICGKIEAHQTEPSHAQPDLGGDA